MKLWFGWLLGLFFAVTAQAESSAEALQLLQRMATSARTLTYSGTFVYQSGQRSETSRITHSADAEPDIEHIEMLDGSPREVIRIGDEVRCYLPETRRMVIERRTAQPRFPSLLPSGLADIDQHYTIRRVANDRVAGFEAHPVSIEPRDDLRFRRQLWIDRKSGLLLKEESFDESGVLRESFAFTQLQIGGTVDREAIKARFAQQDHGWKIKDVRASASRVEDGRWQFRTSLPGFKRVANMTRKVDSTGTESIQMVFSDGLAAISVFVETVPPEAIQSEVRVFAMGAVNVYKRIAGKHLLVLMGDVPVAALRRFGDGIDFK
jgi:sigma-E factor negative regulatory protein RseB